MICTHWEDFLIYPFLMQVSDIVLSIPNYVSIGFRNLAKREYKKQKIFFFVDCLKIASFNQLIGNFINYWWHDESSLNPIRRQGAYLALNTFLHQHDDENEGDSRCKLYSQSKGDQSPNITSSKRAAGL